MINYEIHIIGEENPFYIFSSNYAFNNNERLFIKKEGKIYSLIVSKITHDLTKEDHIVRLNCHFKKMFTE